MAAIGLFRPEGAIQWEWAKPGVGNQAGHTHCCVCLEENPDGILAHRVHVVRPDVEGAPPVDQLGDRVHRACLLKVLDSKCPLCRAPYIRSEIPSTLAQRSAERISEMLLEGKKVWKGVCVSFLFYTMGGFVGLVRGIAQGVLVDLLKGTFSLKRTFWVSAGSILGGLTGAAVISIVGDTSLYITRRITERFQIQNQLVRKIIAVVVVAIALIGSIWVAYRLFLNGKSNFLANLNPEARAVFDYFDGGPYRGPYPILDQDWDAARCALDLTFGLGIGISAPFAIALIWKYILYTERRPLDGWSAW